MSAEQWIEQARSLTQSSSVPLGVSIATHMDMLLRDTRRDLRTACNALEAVLEKHEFYCEGCDTSQPERCWPECRTCREPWPCDTNTAIETALGVESC